MQVALGHKSLTTAYLLWGLSVVVPLPWHWFYLGKVPVLRILTFNWFWIGTLVDGLKMFEYVNNYNRGVR